MYYVQKWKLNPVIFTTPLNPESAFKSDKTSYTTYYIYTLLATTLVYPYISYDWFWHQLSSSRADVWTIQVDPAITWSRNNSTDSTWSDFNKWPNLMLNQKWKNADDAVKSCAVQAVKKLSKGILLYVFLT